MNMLRSCGDNECVCKCGKTSQWQRRLEIFVEIAWKHMLFGVHNNIVADVCGLFRAFCECIGWLRGVIWL